MKKTTLGLVGAISSLAVAPMSAATAAPHEAQPIPAASSYADLLDPIPNAAERLALVNSESESDGAQLIKAQYYPGPVAHHHHHHNNYYHRRHWRRRHYHHHHHNNY